MSTIAAATPAPDATTPVRGQGRPTPWWGIVALIMTESTIFAGLIASYFFLRASANEWPIGGLEKPEVTSTLIFSFILWGSSIPMLIAERAVRRADDFRLRAGLMLSFLMGAAFLAHTWDDFDKLHFGWRTNAYGSIFYVTVGLHALHVLIGLLMSAVVQIKAWMGKFSPQKHTTVQVYALYWHFVDVVWLFVFPTFILSPHIR
jgi:heme/copper-type cytochrome/quinol oxidase subunit 3